MDDTQIVELKEIIGKHVSGYHVQDNRFVLEFCDDSYIVFYHEQDCCECVEIADLNVVGELNHNCRVAIAYITHTHSYEMEGSESATFTFLNIVLTNGMSINLQFHGESNGHYNETIYYSTWRKR